MMKRRDEQAKQKLLQGVATEAVANFAGVTGGMGGVGGMGGMMGGLMHVNGSTPSMPLSAPLAASSHLHPALCRCDPNIPQLSEGNSIPTVPSELRSSSVSN